MKLLLLDNFDSFTFNLVQLIEDVGATDIAIRNNQQLEWSEVEEADKILISPGPGLPNEAGKLKQMISLFHASKSILGICLGHQAIAEVFGGELKSFEKPFHGHTTEIQTTNPKDTLFEGLPETFKAGLYHSWYVEKSTLPDCFQVTAISTEGVVMGISHKLYDVKGLQFHPESIMTPIGSKIIRNWLKENV